MPSGLVAESIQKTDLPAVEPPSTKVHRLAQLDLLRGLAVLLVLFSHQVSTPASGPFAVLAHTLHAHGSTGVDLFFVLSGFLVGGLLLSEIKATGDLKTKRFLLRRGLKIWPGYYVFLTVALIHSLWHHEITLNNGLERMLPLVFNLQNYLGPYDYVTHCWSLAVEEHFYVALPFLLLLVCRKSSLLRLSESVAKALIFTIAVCTAVRYLTALSIESTNPLFKFSTHLRMDALFFGVLIAYFQSVQPGWYQAICKRPFVMLAIGLIFVNARTVNSGEIDPILWSTNFLLTYLGCGFCLVALLHIPVERGIVGRFYTSRACRIICFIGIYSYSIYLWHFEFVGPFVMDKIVKVLPEVLKFPVGMLAYIVGAVLFGAFAARVIEVPMLRFRDRFVPASSK